MKKARGTRIVALVMAFVMTMSVVFQSDMAISGFAQVLAGDIQGGTESGITTEAADETASDEAVAETGTESVSTELVTESPTEAAEVSDDDETAPEENITEADTTAEVSAEADTTETVSTEADTTAEVSTEADTTAEVSTEADTTETVSTEADTTETVSTETVSTEADTTETVSTEADTAETVSTEADTTEAVSTEADTTEVVSTEADTTEEASTEAEEEAATTEKVTATEKATEASDISADKESAPESGIQTASVDDEEASLAGTLIDLEADGYTATITGISKNTRQYDGQPKTVTATKSTTNSSATRLYVSKKNSDGTREILDTNKYTLSYENNVNAGTATVKVTGVESKNCTGTITANFTILRRAISLETDVYVNGTSYNSQTNYTCEYHTGGVGPAISISKLNDWLTEGRDYIVTYGNNSDICPDNLTNDASAPYVLIICPDDSNYAINTQISDVENDYSGINGTYGFFINYAITTTNFVEGTGSTGFTVKLSADEFVYNGGPITPTVTVIDNYNGKVLTDDEYEVTYENNKNVGTNAKVIVTGSDTYYNAGGKIEKTFTIRENDGTVKSIADAKVTFDESCTYNGQYQIPSPVVKYDGSLLTEDIDYTVSGYTDNKDAGTAYVTITGKGDFIGSITAEFKIAAKSILSDDITVEAGDTTYDTANGLDKYNKPDLKIKDGDIELTEKTDYTETPTYVVRGEWAAGEHTVKVNGANNYTGTRTVTFTVNPRSISDVDITVGEAIYTGEPVKPELTSVKVNGTTLVLDKDYEIEGYSDNIETGDNAKVTIKGIGNYTGTATKSFSITTDKIDMKNVTITNLKTKYSYTGEQIKPETTLTCEKDGETYTLKEGTDYTVTYGENIALGTGSIKYTGSGEEFVSTVEKTFTISAKSFTDSDISVTADPKIYTYNGSAITPEVKVTYNKMTLEKDVDYTLGSTANFIEAGDYTGTVTGKGNYTGTKSFTFSIVKSSGSMADMELVAIEDQTYTGNAIEPDIELKSTDGTTYRLSDGDFTADFSDNTNVGTATVKLTGNDTTISGERTVTFDIVPKNMEDCDITLGFYSANFQYENLTPRVTAKNGTRTMTQNLDYTVEYTDNYNASEKATVTVSAKSSNYTGEKALYFTINPVNIISASGFSVNSDTLNRTYEYTGSEIKPVPAIKYTLNRLAHTLVEGEDYTVTYTGDTTQVTPAMSNGVTITVTAMGNFTGTLTYTYKISAMNVNSCDISDIGKQQYTGEPVTPDVELYNGETLLVKDEDYTLSYENNTDIGKATVTITGMGNYSGSRIANFEITQDLTDITDNDKLTAEGLSGQTYKFGEEVTPDFTLYYDGEELTEGTDYSYRFNDNINAGTSKLIVDGKGKYTGEAVFTFDIAKYDIASDGILILKSSSEQYTGSQIQVSPESLTLGSGAEPITEFGEFVISYGENTEVGTDGGSVTLTAKDSSTNYTGKVSQTFDITKRDISDATVTAADVTYSGKSQNPAVTVTLEGKVLPEDSYTVAYGDDCTNAGTVGITVTAAAEGSYTGTASGTFEIKPVQMGKTKVEAIDDYVYTGEEITPEPVVTCEELGETLQKDKDYTVSYDNNTEAGTATATISGKGNYAGIMNLDFTISPAKISDATISGVPETATYTGSDITFDDEITVSAGDTLTLGEDYTLSYDNNKNVSPEGASVTITGKKNYTGSVKKSFVIEAKELEDGMVKDIADQETRNPADGVEPEVTVTDGSNTLKLGTDYTVEYSGNKEYTDSAVAKITGKGNYTGSVSVIFVISKEIIDISGATVTLPEEPYVYSFGDSVEPPVTVTLDGETLGADYYETSYTHSTVAGTATVTVTGKDGYKGAAKTTYTIDKKDISSGQVVFAETSYKYSGEKIVPGITGLDFDGRTVAAEELSFEYSTDCVDAGTVTVTVTAKDTANYEGSAIGKFTISKAVLDDVSATVSVSDQTYTGSAIVPDVKVYYNGSLLTSGSEYEVSIKDNKNAGTATVTVTGCGNYEGTVSAQFVIAARSISDADVTCADVVYSGEQAVPSVSVTLGGATLKSGTDYEVSFAEDTMIDVGEYGFIVTGKGNYEGTCSGTFNIKAKTIASVVVSGVKDGVYTGQEITQSDIVVKDGTKELVEGTDYKVSYENNISATTDDSKAKLIISGEGNYDSNTTKVVEFAIAKADITSAVISGVPAEAEYCAAPITFADAQIRLTEDGEPLSSKTDYSVSYSNNTNAGTAVITFKAKEDGNYTGTASLTFEITPKQLSDSMVSDIQGQEIPDPTGGVTPAVTVKDGSLVLKKDKDYTVEYNNNDTFTSVAEAVVTGKGNYQGTVTKLFTISKQLINISGAEVTFDGAPYVYSFGEPVVPSVTVKLNGDVLDSSAYTLSYTDNTSVGTVTVTVTGAGDYTGVVTAKYTIDKRSIAGGTVVFAKSEYAYTGEEITPEITGVELGDNIVPIDSLVVSYETGAERTDAGEVGVVLTAKSGTNFTGSVSGSFTITKCVLDETNTEIMAKAQTYSGAALEPELTVLYNGAALTKDRDYTVTYSSNVNAGTGKVTVAGKGNYDGSVDGTFDIKALDISGANVSAKTQTYTGAPITPDVTLTLGGKTLDAKYYTVEIIGGNTDKGTVDISVTGQGNYSGTATGTFEIAAADIADCSFDDIEAVTYNGQAQRPAVVIKDKSGEVIPDTEYKLTYTNNTNVTTTASRAKVEVEGQNNYSGTYTLYFDINPMDIGGVTVSGLSDAEYTGDAVTASGYELKAGETKLRENADYTVSYENNKELGEATIIFKGAGNYSGEKTATFTITQAGLTEKNVADIAGQLWTGEEVKPEVTVKNAAGTKLTEGKDYTVSYSNNVDETTDESLAVVTVTGIGNYTGKVTKKFSISVQIIDIKEAKVSSIAAQTYAMGEALTPDVTVMYNGNILDESNYSLKYSNNTDAGQAKVTITGKGRYTGTKEASFTIKPLNITGAVPKFGSDTVVYNGSAQTPELVGAILEDGTELGESDVAGFDMTCTNNIDAGKAEVSITASGNFSGTLSGSFTIEKASIDEASVKVESAAYDGTTKEPAVVVTLGGVTLDKGTDYTLKYSNNTDAGTGSVEVTGCGNYEGSISATFEITRRSLDGAVIDAIADVTYTGSEVSPEVKVTCSGDVLTESDYDVIYDGDMVNAGTVNVTIKGKGNYTGTAQTSFNIVAAGIEDAKVSDIPAQTYTGSSVTPELGVSTASGVPLVKNKDYVVTYTGNVDVTDEAKAVITGKGNYTGKLTRTFAITGKSIEDATVSGYDASVSYTGAKVEFAKLTVTDGSRQLVAGVDYTVSYTGNENVTEDGGTYFTITGKGNYKGSLDIPFTITRKDIAELSISEIESQEYTGKALKPDVTIMNGETRLVNGTDYEISYTGNTDVTDKAEAVITGKGNYSGTVTKYFVIARDLIDISKADVEKIADQTYAFGDAIVPAVKVTYEGETLTEGRDYTMLIENNVNAGTATVTITGTGNYNKSRTTTFVINPADISKGTLELRSNLATYTGAEFKPSVVSLKISDGETVETISDFGAFDISYDENAVDAGTHKVVLTAKTGGNFTGSVTAQYKITAAAISSDAVTVSDTEYTGAAAEPAVKVTVGETVLKEGTDYTVSVGSFVDVTSSAQVVVSGTGNYTGSVTKTFAIKAKSIAGETCTVDDAEYTGSDIKPGAKLVVDGRTLKEGTDYTVSYYNNKDVTKEAQAVVKGIGNYTGDLTVTFEITAKTITSADVADIEAVTYTGFAVTPAVTVTDGSRQLVKGVDYDVTYANNTNKTKQAKATITGKGNYTGKVIKTFEICGASIAVAVVSGVPASAEYTGSSITFDDDIAVMLDGKPLAYGVDYSISYEANVNATTDTVKAYVIISGMDNYGGQCRVPFEITPKSLEKCTIDAIEGQVYADGKPVEPEATVRDDGTVLEPGEDYTVEYSGNTAVTNKATVKVTGKGNYSGTLGATFTIAKEVLDITNAEIAEIADQTYNYGEEIRPEVKVTLGSKTLVPGDDYAVTYTNNKKVGTATVTVSGSNQNKGKTSRTFVIKPIDITKAEVVFADTSYTYTGSAVNADVAGIKIGDRTVEDMSAFTVSCSDNVSAGTATAVVTAKDGQGFAGSTSGTYTIGKASIDDAVITVGSVTYTGSAVTPACTVVLDGRTLVEGTDYTVSCTGNTAVTDSAKAVISGLGNYTGSRECTFKVNAKSLAGATVTAADAVYTGSEVSTTVTVVVDKVTLKQGTDYTVSYKDNINATSGAARATVVVSGCGNYGGSALAEFVINPKSIEGLDIGDIAAQVYAGAPVKPEITIKDGSRTLAEGDDYTVSFEDNDSVTTNAKAVITGKGNYTGSVTKTFEIGARNLEAAEITGVNATTVYTGSDIEFAGIEVKLNGEYLTEGTDYTVSYKNNRDVTTDTSKACVVVTGKGNYSGTAEQAFAITARNIGRYCSIDPIGGQKYEGKAVCPEVVVRDGSYELVKDKDYTVEYSGNTAVTSDDSKAQVTVTGKGNYKGTLSASFTISEDIKDIGDAEIKLSQSSFLYNFGEEIKPDVTVTLDDITLEAGADYELVFIDNKNEGTATVQVNGIGRYSGVAVSTFVIEPIDITDALVVLESDSYEYTGSAVKPAITKIAVTRDDVTQAVTSLDAFNVTYADNTNAGSASVKVTAKSGSGFTGSVSADFEITKADIADAVIDVENAVYTGSAAEPSHKVTLGGRTLAEGTDYTVSWKNNTAVGDKAQIVVTGTGNYKGTANAVFSITAVSLDEAEASVSDAVYDGSAQTPAVRVVVGKVVLKENTDYTVTYSNNVNATTARSKASAVITGTGSYSGKIALTFDIAPKSIDGAVISDIAAQKYTGDEVRPAVTVTLGGVLVEGTDYTVGYEDNIEATDSAVVRITGKGNYTGSAEKTFTISRQSIEDAEITGIKESVTYTGKAVTFDDILVTLDGEELSENEDYTITYADNVNASQAASVVISGCGNYSGSITKTFVINAKSISGCTADPIESQKYTGSEIKPAVVVRDGGRTLTNGTDYTVEYKDNINVGTASVTITGKGNYAGNLKLSFGIASSLTDISKAVIGDIASQYYNFGDTVTPAVTVTFAGKTLVQGTDYAVAYADNIEVGTATVTVKGIGSNTGSVKKTFEIKPIDIGSAVVSLGAASYPYTGNAIKPAVVSISVKRNGKTVALTDYDGLDITYSDNIAVGTGKVVVTAENEEGYTGTVSKEFRITGASVANAVINVYDSTYTGAAVIPDFTVTLGGRTLVEGTDFDAYFSGNVDVTERAVIKITGKGNYSGSATATFAVKAKRLETAEITVASAKYTGNAVTPAISVKLDGNTLVADRDFTVEYSDNVNVTTASSKAYVTITGIGNYTGSASEEFDITSRDISLTEVSGMAAQTYTGNPVRPAVTVTDGDYTLVAGKDYTVSYRNNTQVTRAAVAVITGNGNYSGSVTKTFVITEADISSAVVTGIKDSVTYTGKAITFAGIKVTYDGDVLTEGTDYSVSYSGNMNVTDSALVTIVGKGNYTGSIKKYFAIIGKDISECYVSEIEGQRYTGAKIEPAVVVTYGDTTLKEDVDYTVSYSNNIGPADASSPAVATITGIGSYSGTVEIEFTITKNAIDISKAELSKVEDQTFAKTYIVPDVTVKYDGETLKAGADYKISYENNYDAGTATIHITGYGDYVGRKQTTFKIAKKDVSGFVMTLDKTETTYTGKPKMPDVTSIASEDGSMTLDSDELADFTVRYTSNVNAGTATVTATAGSRSNYTGSVTANFTIGKASLDGARVSADSCEYTGGELTPEVTVTVNGVEISSDNYTVSYENNTDVGTAGITVTGKANYAGTVSGTFEITKRSIKNCDVTYSASVQYTGDEVTSEVVVKNGSQTLKEGTDYILSYESNVQASNRAKVTITGKGNYKDSVTRYFAITKLSIAGAQVTGISNATYTGHPITQNVAVTLNGSRLVRGTDYTVGYSKNTNAGTATVTITGAGNYTDSVNKSFRINRVDISKTAVVSGITSEVTYSGTDYTFDNIKVTWGQMTLKENTDYTVSYKGNDAVTLSRNGKATCTLTFIGNYKGSISKSFKIKAHDISKAVISAVSDKAYTGSAIKPAVKVTVDGAVLDDSQYTVSYSNNVKPGTATIVITGKNNYYGTCKTSFNIMPPKTAKVEYVSSTSSSVKVKWSSVVSAAGYEIYKYDSASKKYVKVANATGNSYTVAKLSAGTDYTIGVKAYAKASNGKLLYSDMVTVKTATCPAKTASLQCESKTNSSVTIKWSKVAGAAGYTVYRYDAAKKTYVTVKTVNANTQKYTVTGLGAVTNYTFMVRAYRYLGKTTLWSADTTLKVMTKPGNVSGLKVTDRTDKTATVKWNSLAGVSGYRVFRYDTSKKKYVAVKTVNANTTSLVISGLSPATSCTFMVRAYKVNGKETMWSGDTTVKTKTKPSAVTGLKLVGRTDKSLTVSWSKVSGADGYVVYRYDTAKKKYAAVKTVNAKTLRYTVSGLSAGTTYKLMVRAYCKNGSETLWSTDASLNGMTNPKTVAGLRVTDRTDKSVTIKWNGLTGVSGYRVFRYDTAKKTYTAVKTVNAKTTSLVISGLSPATGYTFMVRAYKESGRNTLWSGDITVKTKTKPSAVTGLRIANRAYNSLTVSWNKVSGADGYMVYRYDTAKRQYVAVKTVNAGTQKYTLGGLAAGTTYTVMVRAYCKNGNETLWSTDATTKGMTNPKAVSGLKVTGRSNTTITLKWNRVAKANGYIIYRYVGKTPKKIKTITNPATLKFVSSKLKAGTTYKYKVVAYSKSGGAVISSTAKYISSTTLPSTPIVSAKAGKKKASLGWRKVNGASGYVVYMATSKTGKYKKTATVNGASKKSYTKSGLTKGKTYYFKVRAYRTVGGKTYYSSYSTVRKVKVK